MKRIFWATDAIRLLQNADYRLFMESIAITLVFSDMEKKGLFTIICLEY